jgi:hypothetical protein
LCDFIQKQDIGIYGQRARQFDQFFRFDRDAIRQLV